jgi:hypothetical protein
MSLTRWSGHPGKVGGHAVLAMCSSASAGVKKPTPEWRRRRLSKISKCSSSACRAAALVGKVVRWTSSFFRLPKKLWWIPFRSATL